MTTDKAAIDAELESLQRDTFRYFLLWTNPQNGLVLDKTAANWPASIAATGLALAAYPVAVERGFITRAAAIEIVLTPCDSSGTARTAPNWMLPVTTVFIIIFSTCKPDGVPGNANYRPWTVPFCSPGR